jgi:arylsulfatase
MLVGCFEPEAPVAPAPSTATPPRAPRGGPPPPGPFHATPTFDLEGAPAASPRSIVLVSLDTVSAERLGVYGGRAETPTLSAFAGSGARFDQAITHFPETCLSHWSMVTGVPPEAHGDAPALRGSRTTLPTVAEIASRHGYATAGFIGGVTLTDVSCGFGRGFKIFDDHFPLDEADLRRPGAEVTRRAADWIGQQKGPYLAFVHYFDAHFPYTPAPPWDTRYDPDYEGRIDGSDAVLRPYRDGAETPSPRDIEHVLALYDGELSELDALLAPVLEAAGPDAVVLITADHGESFHHDYWFNHRDGLWDDIVRVPLLLRGPGVPAGAVIDQQVGLIDVAPTLLDLAGLPIDRRTAGRSLAPLLRGESGGRAVVFSTTDPSTGAPQRSRRTLEQKVILRETGALVYDLANDPAEARALGAAVDADAIRAAYAETLAPFTALQAPAPVVPTMSPEEAERLRALGYLDPTRDPRAAPR